MRKIQTGDTVKVHYTGKLEDGSIFDTSLTERSWTNRSNFRSRTINSGIWGGFNWHEWSEKKTVEIESADAYGEPRAEMINEVPKANVPEGVQAGEMLQGMSPQGPVNVKVVSVTEDTVTLDANHPLAGKKLIFDLEIVSIS